MDDLQQSSTPEEKPKMTLPVVFDRCPVCGGAKRLGLDYLNQLREEGLLHKDSFKGGMVHQVALVDQAHPPAILAQVVNIKVLYIHWDICGDCGTQYCTKFNCVDTPAQVQVQPPPNAGQPRRMFNGGMPPFARG